VLSVDPALGCERRSESSMGERAVFLDRDGTLVQPRHYPSRPEELCLYEGIEIELRRLQAAGFRLIVITNQGGLAHGYFTSADLDRMHAHLGEEFARLGVRLDGIYHCPHHPEGSIAELAIACDCRKPQPGMLLRAAADFNLDLRGSWFVGDILDDVEAGKRAGCATILVDIGTESSPATSLREPHFVARDTPHALSIISTFERLGPVADLSYLPPNWQQPQELVYAR
jgi:D-glycero-D-manno-heptose 1,7-bisphosphate phosphatase